jgi:hypothetical protein
MPKIYGEELDRRAVEQRSGSLAQFTAIPQSDEFEGKKRLAWLFNSATRQHFT